MKVDQNPICVDDFGNEVHKCGWTGRLVSIADAVISGGFYPGVKSSFLAVKDHHEAKRYSKACFDESEGNCNACKHLIRVKHEKNRAGFLHGKCAIQSQKPQIYPMAGDVMMFHPDDPMHMPCWTSR